MCKKVSDTLKSGSEAQGEAETGGPGGVGGRIAMVEPRVGRWHGHYLLLERKGVGRQPDSRTTLWELLHDWSRR